MKIVIVEDDSIVVDYLTNVIRLGWPEAVVMASHLGNKGVQLILDNEPDIVILDLGLPDISGFDVLKQVRLCSDVPIVLLSARSTEYDVVQGLNLGADEYIIKPFRNLELLARLRCLLKRQKKPMEDLTITYGPFKFGSTIRDFIFREKEIKVTVTEGQLLHKLMCSEGSVVTTTELAHVIWGDFSSEGLEGIRVYIYRLRQKLEDNPSDPKIIINKPGVGYYMLVP
ncbi:MAG: response regulator transcription factor [Porphyromonadaceae bacterium]|nr:response regulator transcription factor [Porphyromonadaceae bacterium]